MWIIVLYVCFLVIVSIKIQKIIEKMVEKTFLHRKTLLTVVNNYIYDSHWDNMQEYIDACHDIDKLIDAIIEGSCDNVSVDEMQDIINRMNYKNGHREYRED